MESKIVEALEAYTLGYMAKDLSSRWANPNKVIRTVGNMQECIQALQNTSANPLLAMLQQAGVATQPAVAQPVAQPVEQPAAPKGITHKDLTKRLEHFERGLLGKIESLINRKETVET